MKPIRATQHCIERYQDYCNSSPDRRVVISALVNTFRRGRVVDTTGLPSWVNAKRPNNCYLLVGENMVFPLVDEGERYVAITCLHRRYAERRQPRKELLSW